MPGSYSIVYKPVTQQQAIHFDELNVAVIEKCKSLSDFVKS